MVTRHTGRIRGVSIMEPSLQHIGTGARKKGIVKSDDICRCCRGTLGKNT